MDYEQPGAYSDGMRSVRILGKRCDRAPNAPVWKASRWPFAGSILLLDDGRYGWRLRLHPSFQSTTNILDGTSNTLEEAAAQLLDVAKKHVQALLWYDQEEDDDNS